MVTSDGWRVMPLASRRLLLEPLRVDHADEMALLLDDSLLHTFIGGAPVSVAGLRSRYAKQVLGGSEDASERWLNWIVRRRDNTRAVGFVQATVTRNDAVLSADVAWVIGTQEQHRGYAQEAAIVMADWLRRQGVHVLVANIHPHHHASNAVARRIGLTPTHEPTDGEVRWTG